MRTARDRSLRRFATGRSSLVVLIIASALGLLAWYLLGRPDRSAEPGPVSSTPLHDEPTLQPAEPTTTEARSRDPASEAVAAERRAVARRTSLEQRWRSARSIAVEKWRADVLTANALGEIGAVPPMLKVRITPSQVQITNRGAGPACVQLARVTRPKTDAVQRCQVGPATCSLIKPGATLRLPAFGTGATDNCLNAALEFRVGNVDFPEPSWWSRTAFNEFSDPPMDIGYKDEADLQADIARFEATVEDQDRAVRWRRSLLEAAATAR